MKPIQPPDRHTELANTGERFLPSITRSSTGLEHYHRYLLAAAAVTGRRVLDIACGEGYGTSMLAQTAAFVHGADIDRPTLEHARRKYGGRDNVGFLCADCERLPLADGAIDCVVSFETIEHIHDQHAFLREVTRVLRPGGLLIVSSPNRTPYNLQHQDNEFHEEELEKEEFRALLAEHFGHVMLGQQQALYMSLVSGGESTPMGFIEKHAADGAFHGSRALDALTYSIAFASDAPIDAVPNSALLDTAFDGASHRYQEDSAVYEIRDPGVKTMLEDLTARVRAAEAEAAARAEAEAKAEAAAAETAAPADGEVEAAGEPTTGAAARDGLGGRADADAGAEAGKNGLGQRLAGHGKSVARGLGMRSNPLAGAGGPSNTMQPLPKRIVAAAARVASRAALWVHRLRPSVARSVRRTSGLFDANFYRRRYYDVSGLGDTLCAVHYAVHGWREGRQPGRLFDPDFYLREYPDVGAAGMSPLLHYVLHGADEWRAPHPDLRADSKLLIGGQWSYGNADGSEDADAPAAGTIAPEADHWADFERFRSYIEGRRADARRAWAPVAPKLVRVDPGRLDAAVADLDRALRLAADPRVSIVIPVHDELVTTLECLAAIAAATTGEYEVVVVDDASTPETARRLAALDKVRYVRQDEQRGFGRTCNRGVEEARAELVVLLNSDTQVREGWLEPMLAPLASDDVGMVGPKLLFPEGVLQEAGGRLRFDGAGDMVGLFEDPDAARFSYSRVVDYASAACVAFRRSDFRRLGGFDERYSPAYCEDADLCLKMQAEGRAVVYEPGATVVHHLSKTTRAAGQRNKVAMAQEHQLRLYERWGSELEARDAVRLMAFYLPQYHPVPENDRWWGEGFTEWRNVGKARPRFRGHRQPRLPANLGYYDLRVPGTMRRQAELAQRFGIYGFAFYYYRLSGRRILEMPLEQVRNDPDWTMPFSLCWANENWTRQWDGQEKHILLRQEYGDHEDLALIEDFITYFEHPAYVRVNGAPLIQIYCPLELPDAARTIQRWRDVCRERGIGEIYVVAVESHELMRTAWNPEAYGFDASVEFPPHESGQPIDLPSAARDRDFKGVVHDYRRVVEAFCTRELPAYKRFRGVMPGWDNTARRKDDPHVFVNSGPAEYQTWLEFAIADTRAFFVGDERMVFVNAWNEWAEAAYLEPDQTYGNAFLEATRNALAAERLRG